MLVMNKRSYAVEIPEVGVVDPGDAIDVPDDLGDNLVQQADAWEAVEGHRGGRLPVDDVLADVANDPDKARQALAVERESDKPRKSLISRLEEIINREENG